LRRRMPDTPLAALDARQQKLVENARIAFERGHFDYAFEMATQVLKAAPACAAVRRLEHAARLGQFRAGSRLRRTMARLKVTVWQVCGGRTAELPLESVERALAADPTSTAALKRLAEIARAQDWLETAVWAHEAVRALVPSDVGNTIALGRALLDAGRAREALEIADERLRADPVDAAAQDLMRAASIAIALAEGRWETPKDFRANLRDATQA